METYKKIYNSVMLPVIPYAMKLIATTKAIAKSPRRNEGNIIRLLAKAWKAGGNVATLVRQLREKTLTK